jgi:hypothetical protein
MQEVNLRDEVTITPLGLEFSLQTWASGWKKILPVVDNEVSRGFQGLVPRRSVSYSTTGRIVRTDEKLMCGLPRLQNPESAS